MTTFAMTFKCLKVRQVATKKRKVRGGTELKSIDECKILLVTNNSMTTLTVKTILESIGHSSANFTTAKSAQDAQFELVYR